MAMACKSVGITPLEGDLKDYVIELEEELKKKSSQNIEITVESIQDAVEKKLMAKDLFDAAKSFILYRDSHTKKRNDRILILDMIPPSDRTGTNNELNQILIEVQERFTDPVYDLSLLSHKFNSFFKVSMNRGESLTHLVKAAVELTVQDAPDWEYISSQLEFFRFYEDLSERLIGQGITSFYQKIKWLSEEGLYGVFILDSYTKEEVDYFDSCLDHSRNSLLTFSSLDLLLKRYVIRDREGAILEVPQEMFMGIAMHLCMRETENRSEWVLKTYSMLSQLQVTMATPTLSNARKPFHQLSSCFIDTVPDSLEGIYRSISSFAQVSKYGGGMGLYFGKIRAVGSPIRGFKGAAGGVHRWIKLANDTAVAVDQLGVRQGAVAVYLDIWHKDIPEFLQLKTNNGDDRMKAHDVFPALCVPDYFWKQVQKGLEGEWQMVCPHEVLTAKGYSLEDSWGDEWENRYLDCLSDKSIEKRSIPLKDLVRMMIKSAVETGTPFIFNRDHVNRMNPNSHKGIIYSSNLCTEIAQNMSASSLESKTVVHNEEGPVVVETTKPGDFVVCNLASLVLGNIDTERDGELEDIVKTAVRALDNVIDLNFYPIPYAELTNRSYRPIGLGVSGYHHLLAQKGIAWESENHLEVVDILFDRINFAAIEGSSQLAVEKGAYDLFPGSDWETGAYFEKRDYHKEKWTDLAERVAKGGMRNGYLLAVAPTSSTSIVAGTTAGIDPVMKKFFLEEKKGMIVPRVAPSLSMKTFWLYKNAHNIDQHWSIRAAGVRQRHIDQAQSLNLYITTDFSLRQVLDLYLSAWKEKVKTVYYIRSKSLEVEECESCSS